MRKALVALALVIALVGLSHPGRVAAKSLILLPNLFPNSPVRPLDWLSGAPRVETIGYDTAAGHVDADVYHPASGGPHGAVLLVLGAGSRPKNDPLLVQFADGLARDGAVVLIPELASLREGVVVPADADMLVNSFQQLQAMPDVDPARIGYVGFSVGGGLSIMAAEDPRIRDQVAFVNTLGAYFDARTLFRAVATRGIEVDGRRIPWEPSDHTRRIMRLQLVSALQDPADRAALDGEGPLDAPGLAERLTPQGRAVLEVLRGVTPARLDQIQAQLPPEVLTKLDSISPDADLRDLHARLYVMHDLGDSYIPFTESRALVATQPPTLQAYTEFDIFQHVTPDKSVDLPTFAWNIAKLYRHVYLVCLEFL